MQRVARAAVGREVLEHFARVVVFVYRKLAQTGVRPVVRAAFGDAVRVLVRYRLERVVGIELLKLVDEVSLFAVFFPGEVGKILGLVHVVGNVRLLDGGEAKFLPQLAERVLGNKAHRQPCADRLAQRAHPVAQAALARRQQIVVLAAVPRSFAHEQNSVLCLVFVAESVGPHENAQHRVVARAILRAQVRAQRAHVA